MADRRTRLECQMRSGVEAIVLSVLGRSCFDVCSCEAERIVASTRLILSFACSGSLISSSTEWADSSAPKRSPRWAGLGTTSIANR